MLTVLFGTKSCFLLLHMPPLSLLTVCAISPTPGSPGRYLMTHPSHSLSPFTCIQSWSFSGPLYYIIFIQFIITHTHSKLCPIWTHQLACYCSQSSSIIVHLTIPLFSTTSVDLGPSHTSPNWLATPSQPSTTGTTIPTCVLPFSLYTGHSSGLLDSEVMALHSLKTLGTTHPMTMSHFISTAIRPSSFSS